MAEQILHYAGTTLRIQGTGLLRMKLLGLDRVKSFTATPLTMSLTPSREPTKLLNFNSQRTLLRVETTAINEYMKVNRIVLFAKPIYSQFPSVA